MEPDPKVLNNGGGVTLIANWVEGMCDPASPRIPPEFTQGNAPRSGLGNLVSRQGPPSSLYRA